MTGQSQMSGVLSEGSLTNTPWRKTGVKYATNEIYFDIVEELDATIDPYDSFLSLLTQIQKWTSCFLGS